jgi:F0F1-type ATP synthase assembly protein I
MSQKRPGQGPEETRLARHAKSFHQISSGAMIPSMLLIGMGGGYFLGVWLEGRTGGEPWVGLAGLVLGGVASVRKIIQMMRSEARSRKDGTKRGDDRRS